jgi:exosortase
VPRPEAKEAFSPVFGKLQALLPRPVLARLSALTVLTVALAWAYWPTLDGMRQRWAHDPQYSHGYLVPVFALVLLWVRRPRLAGVSARPSAWGIVLLAAGGAARLLGARYYLEWLEAASLLPSVAGVCVLLGGWRVLRWSWPAVAFLLFMIPLPYRVQGMMALQLQGLATQASTYVLQTIGLPALAEGNVIILDDVRLGIEEACSGLTMLVTFFALSTALALVIRRPLLDRAVMVASAVPVALLANVARIVVTGVLHETVGHDFANAVFHEWAGWFMMPLALGFYWVVLKVVGHVLVEREARRPVQLHLRGAQTQAPAPQPTA